MIETIVDPRFDLTVDSKAVDLPCRSELFFIHFGRSAAERIAWTCAPMQLAAMTPVSMPILVMHLVMMSPVMNAIG